MRRPALPTLLLLSILLLSCATEGRLSATDSELLTILGVKVWRVPLPSDGSMQWTIELVDWQTDVSKSPRIADVLHYKGQALISLRPIKSEANLYEFTLAQNKGESRGDLKISICPEVTPGQEPCDNSYSMQFYAEPRFTGKANTFVIADLRTMIGEQPKKQLILQLQRQLTITPGADTTVTPTK